MFLSPFWYLLLLPAKPRFKKPSLLITLFFKSYILGQEPDMQGNGRGCDALLDMCQGYEPSCHLMGIWPMEQSSWCLWWPLAVTYGLSRLGSSSVAFSDTFGLAKSCMNHAQGHNSFLQAQPRQGFSIPAGAGAERCRFPSGTNFQSHLYAS